MIDKLLRGTVHWHRESEFVWSRGRQLILGDLNGNHRKATVEFEFPIIAKLKWSTKLSQRLFRLQIKQVFELGESTLGIVAFGAFYHLNLNEFKLQKVSEFPGPAPLRMCFDGENLIYGEYFTNKDRNPVNVFWSDDLGKSWRKQTTLTDIRHVHGVFHDSVEQKYWMTSGDLDHESHIRWSQDLFSTFETVHSGKQLHRIIEMLFLPDRIIYGTDTPYEQNFIVEMDRASRSLKNVQPVGGSIFFLRKTQAGYFCSTAVEPSESNKSRDCEIWHSYNGSSWQLIKSFRKDFWSAHYFQFGRIQIPAGIGCRDGIWVSPIAATNDGSSIFIDVDELSK